MRARRPAGRGALSVTGESILAQSVQVAPAPRADYAFFAFAKARRDLSASLRALWLLDFAHVFNPKPEPLSGDML
jgi:hypothetical protein